MTKYTENCDVYPSDSVKAYTSGRGVWLDAESEDATVCIKLGAAKARTFARGILALADEIDGGEATVPAEEPALKVGDRVTVVREYLDMWSPEDGHAGTIRSLDSEDEIYPYQVETTGHPHGVWVHEVRRADVDDEPAPAPASVTTPRRLAALKEATALLGYDTPDPDAVTLARFLLED